MEELYKISLALVLTVILGFLVGPFLEFVSSKMKPKPPKGVDGNMWDEIVEHRHGGPWIGLFERCLVLASFWIPEYTIIGGWLAFKVAAKWEVWKNIVQVPNALPKVPQVEYFRARSQLGSYILTKFLIGTLTNVLIGLVSSYTGKNAFGIFQVLGR